MQNPNIIKSFQVDPETLIKSNFSDSEEIINTLESNLEKGLISEVDFLTALNTVDSIEKGGKKAMLGELRMFGGRQYIKTAEGWKFHGKGTGVKAKSHVEGSKSKEADSEGVKNADPDKPYVHMKNPIQVGKDEDEDDRFGDDDSSKQYGDRTLNNKKETPKEDKVESKGDKTREELLQEIKPIYQKRQELVSEWYKNNPQGGYGYDKDPEYQSLNKKLDEYKSKEILAYLKEAPIKDEEYRKTRDNEKILFQTGTKKDIPFKPEYHEGVWNKGNYTPTPHEKFKDFTATDHRSAARKYSALGWEKANDHSMQWQFISPKRFGDKHEELMNQYNDISNKYRTELGDIVEAEEYHKAMAKIKSSK